MGAVNGAFIVSCRLASAVPGWKIEVVTFRDIPRWVDSEVIYYLTDGFFIPHILQLKCSISF